MSLNSRGSSSSGASGDPSAVWGTAAEQTAYEEVEKDLRASRRRSKRSRKRSTNRLYKQRMPADVEIMMGEANLQYMSKEFQAALKILTEVIRRSPSSPEPYEVMGLIYEEMAETAREAGRLDDEVSESSKAATAFTLAAQIKSTDGKTWHHAGKAQYSIGDYVQATDFITRAVKFCPHEVGYALDLAHLYSEQEKFGAPSRRSIRLSAQTSTTSRWPSACLNTTTASCRGAAAGRRTTCWPCSRRRC